MFHFKNKTVYFMDTFVFQFVLIKQQAHKVCVGQNELDMSLLEDFGLNLTLK
jgi:hypothetical protein